MKGMMFSEFVEWVERTWSEEVADTMIDGTALPSGGAYTSVGTYDHGELVALVVTLSGLASAQNPMTLTNDGLTFPDGSTQNTAATSATRLYYLSDTNYISSEALTACGSGYHLASMWEIFDPSNLVYAFSHPDAHTKSDSGAGPPSGWYGRVRTGAPASSVDSAGDGNCSNWTSDSGSDYGTSVRLKRAWETPDSLEHGAIWDASSFPCSFVGPVWCIQDHDANAAMLPYAQALPGPEPPPNSMNASPGD